MALVLLQTVIPVDLLLMVISLIIIVGFLSEAIFRRTRIPEVLILMFIGLLLGPIGSLMPQNYISLLREMTPIFGTIALVMIMFNSGKIMKFSGKKKLRGSWGIVLAFADFAIPAAIMPFVMYYLLGWPLIYGALLGIILGETSTIMVLPFIRKLRISPEFYNMEVNETTFNSVFSILAFYFLLLVIQGGTFTVSSYVQYALSYISIAVFIGLIGGFGWLLVRNIIKAARNYLATISIAILIYGIVDLLSASAVVSVLIFAIIIGNAKVLNRYLNLRHDGGREESKEIENGLEFLVKTFFFVFIGIITILSINYFIYGLIIVAILIVTRYGQVFGLYRNGDRRYRGLLFSLLPRGLAVAVLSSTLYSIGGVYNTEIFYICSIMLILTNIAFAILASRSASTRDIRSSDKRG